MKIRLDNSTLICIMDDERRSIMAWLAYLIGLLLIFGGVAGFGMAVFAIGMVMHWKAWIAIIGGFFVGLNWNSFFK